MTVAPYPNAPLAMVLLEVRHPRSEVSGPALTLIKEKMSAVTPIERVETVFDVEFNPSAQAPPTQRQTLVRKLIARDVHTAVTFRPEALIVETTEYLGWKWFRGVVALALRARNEFAPIDGVERVGLRYYDEVRVPRETTIDWSQWVARELLGPYPQATELKLRPSQHQGIVQLESDIPGLTFTLRYGAGHGFVVGSSENLRRPDIPAADSEFFLLDTDAAWSDPNGSIPEYEADHVLKICDQLHAPIKDLFESLITDRLRNEVLKNVN